MRFWALLIASVAFATAANSEYTGEAPTKTALQQHHQHARMNHVDNNKRLRTSESIEKGEERVGGNIFPDVIKARLPWTELGKAKRAADAERKAAQKLVDAANAKAKAQVDSILDTYFSAFKRDKKSADDVAAWGLQHGMGELQAKHVAKTFDDWLATSTK
ncbi:unnamed protein product [Phytophthora fragariaefolia]|uniref:RxLR effector protein n=1 Tax=Phytophthora fragariaefolia TaxID=1490495 RepID=A0A9W6XVT2_9STRA|nr:unnamed protein product [Phytophthora fragariaefolia]